MSDAETEVIVASDDAASQQNAAPGQQNADIAQPQTDGDAEGDQQADEGGEKLTDEQKAIRRLERRIDRLTAGRGAARREAELLREQMAQMQARPQEQEGDEQRIDPREIDRIANERARELAQRDRVASKVNAVLDAGKKLAGFAEAANAVAEEVPFMDQKGRPTPFIEAVLDADEPAALLHWLGNNPDEAAQFTGLSPAQIGRRLAKLEERVRREAKSTSNAPTPLRPVAPRSGSSNLPDDADSVDDWMRKERARTKARFA